MKKLMLFAAIAVFGFAKVQAQGEIQFGAKAGVNFAKLTGDDVEDADGRTGFHIGGLVEIPISEKFSVQPEIVYSQQGLQSKSNFDGIEIESKLKLDYINIPVMAKFYVSEGFAIEAGPQFGFNVSSKFEAERDGESFKENAEDVAGFDLSLGAGLSYKLDSGLFFQGRYMFGLSNVNQAEEEGFDDNLTNSVLSLSIGFMF